MKTKAFTKYQCEICGTWYETPESATLCESRPKSEDKGVKVGDIVTVTTGDGAGLQAEVDKVFVYDMEWGHYQGEKYWHTVGLTAKLIGHWGSRQLTFDSYTVSKETIPP